MDGMKRKRALKHTTRINRSVRMSALIALLELLRSIQSGGWRDRPICIKRNNRNNRN
jgi:hypothetical protein